MASLLCFWASVRDKRRSSHASKVMLNILQARLQQYVNRELPDVQARQSRGSHIWPEEAAMQLTWQGTVGGL